MPAALLLRFGRYEIQPQERRLLVDGVPSPIGRRAFDVLVMLAERPGSLVTKQQLLERVWAGLYVEEANLTVQVSGLRKVLGPQVIVTVPGHGYRFVPPAAAAADDAAVPLQAASLSRVPEALIGREDDLPALAAMLREHRLVTVLGAGGVGKSSIARHVVQGLKAQWRHGTAWVELGPVTEPGAVAATVATAVGLPAAAGDPLQALAPLELLLVLDNAEHLLDAVAALAARLLASAERVTLLVTSQAPLRLAAEQPLHLLPLALPPPGATAAQAPAYGAVALFLRRARTAGVRWDFDDDAAAQVGHIVRALDGVPLAIELAAARAPALGLRGLQQALEARFAVLTRNADRSAPARQQTLRAALEWSHGLLQPREQQVFRRLAVFTGLASLHAVREVVADDTLDGWDAVDALASLVERSLVATAPGADGEPRYRLLDSARALALEQLRAAGEEAALRQRHAVAMAAHAWQWWQHLWSGEVPVLEHERAFEPDHDDAAAAFRHAAVTGDADTALRLAAVLLPTFRFSRPAERGVIRDAAMACFDRGTDVPVQCAAAFGIGGAWSLVDEVLNLAWCERALALAQALEREAPDRWRLCNAWRQVGLAALRAMNLDRAREATAQAAALHDPAWPPMRQQQHHALLAQQLNMAERRYRESAVLWRRASAAMARAGGDTRLLDLVAVHTEMQAGDPESVARAAELAKRLMAEMADERHQGMWINAAFHAFEAEESRRNAPGARAALESLWPRVVRTERWSSMFDLPARLAALEGRDEVCARLVGYAYGLIERAGLAVGRGPMPVSQAALDRLGPAAQPLMDEGRQLSDEEAAALAGLPLRRIR